MTASRSSSSSATLLSIRCREKSLISSPWTIDPSPPDTVTGNDDISPSGTPYEPSEHTAIDTQSPSGVPSRQVRALSIVADADITHRQHAICETVWSDLIDGPWAHQPSGLFAANAAWCILAAICHNLLRAAGTLASTTRYALARGATLRTRLINIPARLARPQRRPVLHLPTHWPHADACLTF